MRFDLGTAGGVALSFTDAAVLPGDADAAAGPTLLYTAAAEASPDATRDGAVAGSAIGVIAPWPAGTTARWAPLRDAAGRSCTAKAEGIVIAPDDPTRLYVVLDRDTHDEPSELCEVTLTGHGEDWDDRRRLKETHALPELNSRDRPSPRSLLVRRSRGRVRRYV